MAPPGPQLVHKQFNSPLGLYSAQNVRETLGKHLTHLDNGVMGIDWSAPGAEQPANLANSAVLRLLREEESAAKNGQKKVVWPPTADTNGYPSPQQKHGSYQPAPQPAFKQPPYQPAQPPYQPAQPAFRQQPPYQPAQPPYQAGAACEGRRQDQCGLSKLIPVGPGVRAAAGPVSRSPAASNRWAPVPAPAPASPKTSSQPQSQPLGYSEQSYEEFHQLYGSSPTGPQWSGSPPAGPQWARSPPPTTITLRSSAPLHHQPPPVYTSQPTTHAFKGGAHRRGDAKWPPASVREAVAAENEARRALAMGPACRPRKVNKDYSSFFAAHSLRHDAPGYRAPPGTQHVEGSVLISGRSSY